MNKTRIKNLQVCILCFISIINCNKGFLYKNITPTYIRKLTIKNENAQNEYIPMPPTSEAIQFLKEKGYSYLTCLKALVKEDNNETRALIYLNATNITKDYVK
tara:strand:- start:2247 stop:2555 length:309 start_codon:yes stop_codon:yes gene_type:complete